MKSRIVSEIHKVWDRDWPDRVGSVTYAKFSLGRQLDEIQADLNHQASEFADIIIISYKWMLDNHFDPETTVLRRLRERHAGHTKQIANKYEKLWRVSFKGAEAFNPEKSAVENLMRARRELEALDTPAFSGLSDEKKIMFRQKYERIINDCLEVINKMKIGKKAEFDLASEIVKQANAIAEQADKMKAANIAGLRRRRRL